MLVFFIQQYYFLLHMCYQHIIALFMLLMSIFKIGEQSKVQVMAPVSYIAHFKRFGHLINLIHRFQHSRYDHYRSPLIGNDFCKIHSRERFRLYDKRR